MIYVGLGVVLVAILVFVYFQTRQFIQVIKCLTEALTGLKSFAMGKPEVPNAVRAVSPPAPPAHPDFGLGKVLDKSDRIVAGNEDDEEDTI